MSDYTPQHAAVKADPKRPWKAIVAGAVAFLGLVWANLQGVEDWGTLSAQDWLTIIVPALLVFAGTYVVPNPMTAARKPITQSHTPGV